MHEAWSIYSLLLWLTGDSCNLVGYVYTVKDVNFNFDNLSLMFFIHLRRVKNKRIALTLLKN